MQQFIKEKKKHNPEMNKMRSLLNQKINKCNFEKCQRT